MIAVELWAGRVFLCCVLTTLTAIAVAVVSYHFEERRKRRETARRARVAAEFLASARVAVECGHPGCQAAADKLAETMRLEAAFNAPAAKRGVA